MWRCYPWHFSPNDPSKDAPWHCNFESVGHRKIGRLESRASDWHILGFRNGLIVRVRVKGRVLEGFASCMRQQRARRRSKVPTSIWWRWDSDEVYWLRCLREPRNCWKISDGLRTEGTGSWVWNSLEKAARVCRTSVPRILPHAECARVPLVKIFWTQMYCQLRQPSMQNRSRKLYCIELEEWLRYIYGRLCVDQPPIQFSTGSIADDGHGVGTAVAPWVALHKGPATVPRYHPCLMLSATILNVVLKLKVCWQRHYPGD